MLEETTVLMSEEFHNALSLSGKHVLVILRNFYRGILFGHKQILESPLTMYS